MPTDNSPTEPDFDVIIIGAGISGINAAYRVQSELPDATYAILEARSSMGGTWDLFRYPGIRSDSDLHTFGFEWRPWEEEKAFAGGPAILNYIKDSASLYGIDQRIRYHHKLISADWSSADQWWTLQVEADGETTAFTANFCIHGTGYYNYTDPLDAQIPGLDAFKGTVVHPQFWPEDLDYSGKNIVVIGSGATAITLLPALAQTAAHVTMLQRSPSYILARASSDPFEAVLRALLPRWLAFKIIRWKWIILPYLFFLFCRLCPRVARGLLRASTKKHLPDGAKLDPDWTPSYSPGQQRLCISPDADFFTGLHSGATDVVTGTIARVSATSILLTDGGPALHPDIIVTATGLQLSWAGGAALAVDGQQLDFPHKHLWKGLMVQDLPNTAFCIGYTDSSWTLGADVAAKTACRLLRHMRARGARVAVPRLAEGEAQGLDDAPPFDLCSTYLLRAQAGLPRSGNRGVWRARKDLWADLVDGRWGSVAEGMEFVEGKRGGW